MDQLGSIVIPGMNQVQARPGECHCHGNTDETRKERTDTAQKMNAIRARIAAGEVVMADPEKLIGHCVVLDPCGHIEHSRCMEDHIAQWRQARVTHLTSGAAGDLPDLDCPTCHSIVDHKLIPPGLPPTPAVMANRAYQRGYDLAPAICTNALKVARFCTAFAVGCAISPYLTLPRFTGVITAASITNHLNRFVDAFTSLGSQALVMEYPMMTTSLSAIGSVTTVMENVGREALAISAPTVSTYFPLCLNTLSATATTMPVWHETAYNRNIHAIMALTVTSIIGYNIVYDTARSYFDDTTETMRVGQLVDLTARLFIVWSSFAIHYATYAGTRAIASGVETHVGHSHVFRGMVGIAFKLAFLAKHWIRMIKG